MRRAPVIVSTGLLLVLVPVGCGRKAPPLPPVVRMAQETRDLTVYQEGTDAVLSWSYPSLTTSGDALTDLERIVVWRAHLPADQEPRGTSSRDRQMAEQLFEANAERVLVLDQEWLEQATQGSKLVVRDSLVAWYETYRDQMPLVLWYGVRTVCCDGVRSRLSNVARLEPRLPPPPPQGLAASAGESGVELTWQGEGGLVLVERSADDESWDTLTVQPVPGPAYLDATATQGRTWHYRLRAVEQLEEGGRVVGGPSASVAVDHPDLYPPASAANLVCLPEGASVVRLRWDGGGEAASYQVRRQRDGGSWTTLAATVEGVEFTDESPPRGRLTYAVRARDEAGNLSAESTCSTLVSGGP